MIALIISLFLLGAIGGYIGGANEDISDSMLIWFFGIIFIFILSVGISEGNYFSMDIRKGHKIIYNETEYGTVDSIAYYVNGKIINYNQVNKKD